MLSSLVKFSADRQDGQTGRWTDRHGQTDKHGQTDRQTLVKQYAANLSMRGHINRVISHRGQFPKSHLIL